MYQFYFFDLDGTITDSSLGITNSVRYALAKYGIEEPDRKKLYRFIGPPLTESFREFYGFPEEQCQEAIRYYREYYRDKGIYENQVYDGLEEVLKKLKEAGKQLVVATSKPEVFAREIIRYFHLDSYFSYVAGMELDGGRGTKAEVIEYAIRSCGAEDRREILMIGDRKHDVEGAAAHGIRTIAVTFGYGSVEELTTVGAWKLAHTMEELTALLLEA